MLATWPAEEVRGVVLRRTVKLGVNPSLGLEVAANKGCAWQLEVFADNTRSLDRVIGGGLGDARNWQNVTVDLSAIRDREVEIRVCQRTLVPNHVAGNAYWHNLRVR